MGLARYIGLMSGTSADGVDAVVALFEAGRFLRVETTYHLQHPAWLRSELVMLGRNAQAQQSLAALAQLDVAIAEQFATATLGLLQTSGLQPSDITAIGSHGQTIFHDPRQIRASWQLGDPNLIAARTGIQVAADFRRMDIAFGGEGAPLVPAFHQAVFRSEAHTAVVNIGGIANISFLTVDDHTNTTGYDCGPGNALMDEWAMQHLHTPYDADGQFAARGHVLPALLGAWLAEPFFHLPAPKSTGRALFNLEWAAHKAPAPLPHYAAEDVQATLCELTARGIADAIQHNMARVLICGGGAFNTHLMSRLAALLPHAVVASTETAGLHPQWVEAAAFAWLAHQRVHGLTGNVPSVTGASRAVVLGGLYG